MDRLGYSGRPDIVRRREGMMGSFERKFPLGLVVLAIGYLLSVSILFWLVIN